MGWGQDIPAQVGPWEPQSREQPLIEEVGRARHPGTMPAQPPFTPAGPRLLI